MNSIKLGALIQECKPTLKQDANSKSEQKTNLYVYNPSLRNPERFKNFFSFVDVIISKYGFNTKIKENDIIELLKIASKSGNLLNLKQSEITLTTFTKRLIEISALGLVDFKTETKNHEKSLTFYQPKYSHQKFNDLNISNNEESLFLFILKMRDSLNLISDLILNVNLKSKNDDGIYNQELALIYSLFPLISLNAKLDSEFLSDLILKTRREFEEYVGYQKKNNNLEYSEYIESKFQNIYTDNPNITFNKWNTISDYIDVLFRTLYMTQCFSQTNYGKLKSITFNYNNIEKLSFFIHHSLNEILDVLNINMLDESIKNFSQNEFIQMQNDNKNEDFSILKNLMSQGSFLANFINNYKKEKTISAKKEQNKTTKEYKFLNEDNYSQVPFSSFISIELLGKQEHEDYNKIKETLISSSNLKYNEKPLINFIVVERVNRKTLLDFRKVNFYNLRENKEIIHIPIKNEILMNLFKNEHDGNISILYQMAKDFYLSIKKHYDINDVLMFKKQRIF